MRIHPLHLPELAEGETTVIGDEAHHLTRVLRVRPGARLRAFDGGGREAEAEVLAVEGERLRIRVGAPAAGRREPRLRITLALALLRGDKLADVVRMATELGVVAVQLVVTRRCEGGRPSAARLERLARIAREAAKQSGRSLVPPVAPPVALGELGYPDPDALAVVADPSADRSLATVVGTRREHIILLTGPEGGLEPDELVDLGAAGWRGAHLGATILRAETAPIAAASLLLLGADA